MKYRATLLFSEQLVRKAVLAFWRKSVGAGFFVAMLLLALALTYLLFRNDYSWYTGAAGTVLFLGTVIAVSVYASHFRRSLEVFRRMQPPSAELEAGEEVFKISSSLGESSHPWSVIQEVWQFEDFWLLLLSRAQFMTLPIASLSPELREFILRRVAASATTHAA